MDRLHQLTNELERLAARVVALYTPNHSALGAAIANMGDLLREIKLVRMEIESHT